MAINSAVSQTAVAAWVNCWAPAKVAPIPGDLQKRGTGSSNPLPSSGESRANQTSGAHPSTPLIMSSASACVWLGALISQRGTVWRSRPGAEPAARALRIRAWPALTSISGSAKNR
jgi:hypothetical protein